MSRAFVRWAFVAALAAPVPAFAGFLYELDGVFAPDVPPFPQDHYRFVYYSPSGPIPDVINLFIPAASLEACETPTSVCGGVTFDNSLTGVDIIGFGASWVFTDGAFQTPGTYSSFSANNALGTLRITEVTIAEPATFALSMFGLLGLLALRRATPHRSPCRSGTTRPACGRYG